MTNVGLGERGAEQEKDAGEFAGPHFGVSLGERGAEQEKDAGEFRR